MTAYTLFGGNVHGLVIIADTASYTIGVQFAVSQSMGLTGIWWYSSPSAGGALPSSCVIFNGDTTAQVAGTLNNSPSWSGAVASGWVKCTYDGSVSLSPGVHYVAAIFDNPGVNWYSGINGYWTSGAGASGIANGPLSAPSSASALNGQAVFNAGASLTFPATHVSGYDFGVDVEVTTGSSPSPPPAYTAFMSSM